MIFMIDGFKLLFKDKTIKRFIWLDVFFIISFLIVIIWKWSSLPPQLPLFYSLPRNTDQLASPVIILLLPGLSVIFSIINFNLASFLYLKERLAGLILVTLATIVSFLLLVTFVKIIFLVT